MAKQVFVNEIIEENNGSRTGIVAWNDTIKEDLPILYDERIRRSIEYLIKTPTHPDGFHMFSRFYQLIVLFQYDTKLGISIKLSDYGNNLDNALDHYLKLTKNKWSLQDRNTIMKLFNEIRNDNSKDNAEMIIKFHIPFRV